MRLELDGKIAIVTGAGQGLGRAIAQGLSNEGCAVIIADINDTKLKDTAEMIIKNGGKCLPVKTDVSVLTDLDRLVEKSINTFKRIDIVINNAGICPRTSLEEITEREWDNVLSVNLKSAFFLDQKVMP